LAVLTDGRVWIIFKPFIPGAPYSEKQAIVFPSFDAVQSDFATFYDLLSKERSRLGTYKLIFDKIHENRLFVTQAMQAVINGSDLRIEHKSDASGDDQTSVSWMTNTIIKSIEEQLFEDGNPEWNDLQALYQARRYFKWVN